MKKGKVKFFNREKGYGFITDDESGEEYFVHNSKCTEPIKEEDEVEYDLVQGKKGLNASNVKIAS